MNLLLLLSALLSALTGASPAVRAPQQAVAVSRAAETAARVSASAGVGVRPTVALPRLADAGAITGAAWALTPAVPLFLSRRRE